MRIAIAVVMGLHGLAHLVGFAVLWRLAAPPGGGYPTTLLAGRVAVGEAGMRAVGLVWLLLALGFVAVAAGAVMSRTGWVQAAIGVALFSLMWCLVGWPEARIGALVNTALLAVLVAGARLGWFAQG
jgi:hypothetical protein